LKEQNRQHSIPKETSKNCQFSIVNIQLKRGFVVKISIIRITLFGLVCLLLSSSHLAVAAEGNISDTKKYAWSENAGWQNFRPSNGGVMVHDTYLSGYAWSENLGWIKFGADSGGPYANSDSTDWGVNKESATGALSGYPAMPGAKMSAGLTLTQVTVR
jgi:hypothetical protein